MVTVTVMVTVTTIARSAMRLLVNYCTLFILMRSFTVEDQTLNDRFQYRTYR